MESQSEHRPIVVTDEESAARHPKDKSWRETDRHKSFRRSLYEGTWKFRCMLIKLIAPRLYFFLIHNLGYDTRPTTFYIKEHLQGMLTGAEIGVLEGKNAENILKLLPIKKLYLIDPYLPYVENGIRSTPETSYEIAKIKLKGQPVKFIKKLSSDASQDIPVLDFIYIDGNHSYEYVKNDIENYFPFIKSKGIMGGHDYTKEYPGVIRAVREFAKKYHLHIFHELQDWWFVKPC